MSSHIEQHWVVSPERRFLLNLADAIPAEEVILTVSFNRPLTEDEVLALCPVVDALDAFAKFLKGPVPASEGSTDRPMPAPNTPANEYMPTLLEYAEVIVWLNEQRAKPRWATAGGAGVFVAPPEQLKLAYEDAIQRAALGRVAKAMQAAEDAGDDGLGDMLGSWSE